MTRADYSIVLMPEIPNILAEAKLALDVFMECVAPIYPPEGIKKFRDFISINAVMARHKDGAFWLGARSQRQMIGVLEMRRDAHLSSLFVLSDWQKKGVARALVDSALKRVQKNPPLIREITVNATPNTVLFYESIGFQSQSAEQISDGIRFVPMKKFLKET